MQRLLLLALLLTALVALSQAKKIKCLNKDGKKKDDCKQCGTLTYQKKGEKQKTYTFCAKKKDKCKDKDGKVKEIKKKHEKGKVTSYNLKCCDTDLCNAGKGLGSTALLTALFPVAVAFHP